MAVAPPDQPASNVPPLSRFQAQRKLGLFAGLDYTIAVLMIASWVTLGFWKLFGDPGALQLLAFAAINIVLMQVWIVVLCYRCLVFILDVQADINLMPESAARIVIGFQQGRTSK